MASVLLWPPAPASAAVGPAGMLLRISAGAVGPSPAGSTADAVVLAKSDLSPAAGTPGLCAASSKHSMRTSDLQLPVKGGVGLPLGQSVTRRPVGRSALLPKAIGEPLLLVPLVLRRRLTDAMLLELEAELLLGATLLVRGAVARVLVGGDGGV